MNDAVPRFTTCEFQEMVKAFHEKMGHPVAIEPDAGQLLFRTRLIIEETAEFVEAASRNDKLEMVDALCDLLYVTFGTGVVLGVDLADYFRKVQEKNMQKTPALSTTEKPAKPEGWTPPQDDEHSNS